MLAILLYVCVCCLKVQNISEQDHSLNMSFSLFLSISAVEQFANGTLLQTNDDRYFSNMDLNVAVSTASELFEDSDMVFPILMGRENLKILASPGSESSGVSSLDAEEAKVSVPETIKKFLIRIQLKL